MVDNIVIEKYSLDEQTAMMREVQDIQKENDRKHTVYETQLGSIKSEIKNILEVEYSEELELDLEVDVEKISDEEYVSQKFLEHAKLFEEIDTEYRYRMSEIIRRFRGVESQGGV